MNNINAFWFRHDNAARSDIKVGQLRHKFGRGAYEVFFMLLEILHATGTGYIEYDIPALAYEMREEEEFVQKIIEYAITIGLICEQDGKIFTRRIVSEISERKEYLAQQRKKSKLGVAARVRGKSGQPTGQPTGIPKGQPTDDPKKERKAKESKGDEVKLESNTLSSDNKMSVDIFRAANTALTPAQLMREFLTSRDKQEEVVRKFAAKGVCSEQFIRREMVEFISYWSERTKSGKLQKWETQDTFELGRRFNTWLNRALSPSPR